MSEHGLPLGLIRFLDNSALIMSLDDLTAKLFAVVVEPETFFLEPEDGLAAESFSFKVRSTVL